MSVIIPASCTGLGLAVAQRIMESHGSVITVTSTEGKGTTFSFSLPQARPLGGRS